MTGLYLKDPCFDVAKGIDVPMSLVFSLSLDRSRTEVFFFLWDFVIFNLVVIDGSRWLIWVG